MDIFGTLECTPCVTPQNQIMILTCGLFSVKAVKLLFQEWELLTESTSYPCRCWGWGTSLTAPAALGQVLRTLVAIVHVTRYEATRRLIKRRLINQWRIQVEGLGTVSGVGISQVKSNCEPHTSCISFGFLDPPLPLIILRSASNKFPSCKWESITHALAHNIHLNKLSHFNAWSNIMFCLVKINAISNNN